MKKINLLAFLFLCYTVSYAQSLHTKEKDLPCLDKHYNLIVHAVYDSLRETVSTSEIDAAINTANSFFAPICLSFTRCKMDTVYDYNFNKLKPDEKLAELGTNYLTNNIITLYVISDTLTTENVSGLCSGSVYNMNHAYIYLKSLGSISHELGHFFGLLHTFEGGGTELVDGSNCETMGDKICDTPADPYIPFEPINNYILNCTFISLKKDAHGEYYQPNVGNIMSYYGCDCGFTRGQYLKMAENYLNASQKHW